MEEFAVYILYSLHHKKTYVGYTGNLLQRFKSHNELAHKGYTIRYRPWIVLHVEYFETKEEARRREKFYKTGVGRQHISNFIKAMEGPYPPKA